MYQVRTAVEDRPVVGSDSCLMDVPAGLLLSRLDGGQPAVNIGLLGRVIRYLSEAAADEMGETLHHAEWYITTDAEQVEKLGMLHETQDCARCRSGVDQALARLADTGEPLLVGVLYWAG
jgi:hypothetical protein